MDSNIYLLKFNKDRINMDFVTPYSGNVGSIFNWLTVDPMTKWTDLLHEKTTYSTEN